MTASGSAVYVYGVVSAADAGEVPTSGVDQAKVRVVSHGNVAALVSDLAGGKLAAAREVRAHWRVLEQVSEQATVLPVRFGTALEDDAAVRAQLLEPNADRLSQLLSGLAGRVQLTVKGDYDQDRLLRDIVKSAPAIEAMRQRLRTLPDAASYYERIRVGETVAAEVERQRDTDSRLALDRLAQVSVASRVEPTGSPEAAFNLAFLVERDSVDRFSKAVGDLAAEFGERAQLRYVGPLPPYSFSELDEPVGSAAWA